MEGSKQCPQCKCTDVPVNAEVCPFCGYSFGKTQNDKPAQAGKQPEAKIAETPAKTSGSVMETKAEPAKTATATGNNAPVSEGSGAPASTEYTTYQKKGKKKQAGSGTAEKGQKSKVFLSALATAVAVAAVCTAWFCMYKPSYAEMRFFNPRNSIKFFIAAGLFRGILAGLMHHCCFDNVKGSRKAGIVGIVAGFIYYQSCVYRNSGYGGYGIGFFRFLTSGIFMNEQGFFSNFYNRCTLVLIVLYVVCWFMAAKLMKNSKDKKAFCLTAVVMALLPFLLNWAIYQLQKRIVDALLGQGGLPLFVSCWAAMLLMTFLLRRIRAGLALKPRWLSVVLYVVAVGVTLLFANGILQENGELLHRISNFLQS